MIDIIIQPTLATVYGIADDYNIINSNHEVLFEYINGNELSDFIKENKLNVIGGEKYL